MSEKESLEHPRGVSDNTLGAFMKEQQDVTKRAWRKEERALEN